MNNYRDYQLQSRERDQRREFRRSRGIRGIELSKIKALRAAPTGKHRGGRTRPGSVVFRPGFIGHPDGHSYQDKEAVRGRTYPAVREATSWVSLGRRGRARRLHAATGCSWAQAVRQVGAS
jgi:hypothetical protein